MPAKGGPTKPQRKAAREQKRAQRRARVWNLFMRGVPMSTIATIVDCAPQTVKNDIEEMTQELKDLEPLYAGDDRERAIHDRRHLKSLSLEASAETEAKDRAPLLKEARHNQTGIEDLQELHPKDPSPLVQIGPAVYQIPGGEPLAVKELTDEELERLAALPEAEVEQIVAPDGEAAEGAPDAPEDVPESDA